MKKLSLIILILALLLSLSACGRIKAEIKEEFHDEVIEEIVPKSAKPSAKQPDRNKVSRPSPVVEISAEEAESIALEHLGVDASDVKGLRTELDYDDGYAVYEVQFYYQLFEYDYEISAESGDIWTFDKDK